MARKEFFTDEPLYVYLHIPFCLRACPYCNFNFRLLKNYSEDFVEAYMEALLQEWQGFIAEFPFAPCIPTLYFGGGTPSLINGRLLNRVVQTFKAYTDSGVEITLEANPENLVGQQGQRYLAEIKDIGISRLSIGAQSFDEARLQFLGRNHHGVDVRQSVENARRAGFENISLDVIGFLPNESVEESQENLAKMLACNPDHLSFYGLTIEEKTPFYQQHKNGTLHPPPEEVSAAQYENMVTTLQIANYERYEISNFARPGYRSQHNQCYWMYRPYLGLGAGAHSFFRKQGRHCRWKNISSPEKYIAAVVANGIGVDEEEVVVGRSAMAEFVFTGLRRREGISPDEFSAVFGVELLKIYPTEISKAIKRHWLQWQGEGGAQRLALTPQGVLLSDSVFAEFM